MCGRAYSTYTEDELRARYENLARLILPSSHPNLNFCPGQESAVLLQDQGLRMIYPMRWGLIPFWAKEESVGYKMINAKAETLHEKPSFRESFKKKRCIIPLSGFYEWKKTSSKKKQPYAIFSKKTPILSLAGVWEHWKSPVPENKELETFTIITTTPNAALEQIHHRMPVILSSSADEDRWLDPYSSQESLRQLLQPYSSDLEIRPVSLLVNSPRNNDATLLEEFHDPSLDDDGQLSF